MLDNAALVSIRQPIRMAGQFVFIAVLLHWRKFVCSPDAPRAFRKRLSRLHGKTLHPWQFFRHDRHRAGRLLVKSKCAIADWKPRRSSRWVLAQFHPAAACQPAVPLYPEEGDLVYRLAPYLPKIQTDRVWQFLVLCRPQVPSWL